MHSFPSCASKIHLSWSFHPVVNIIPNCNFASQNSCILLLIHMFCFDNEIGIRFFFNLVVHPGWLHFRTVVNMFLRWFWIFFMCKWFKQAYQPLRIIYSDCLHVFFTNESSCTFNHSHRGRWIDHDRWGVVHYYSGYFRCQADQALPLNCCDQLLLNLLEDTTVLWKFSFRHKGVAYIFGWIPSHALPYRSLLWACQQNFGLFRVCLFRYSSPIWSWRWCFD